MITSILAYVHKLTKKDIGVYKGAPWVMDGEQVISIARVTYFGCYEPRSYCNT